MTLNRRDEYIARWLDRVRECTVRKARDEGIEKSLLEVVRAGRAVLDTGGPEPVFRTLVTLKGVPEAAPPTKFSEERPEPKDAKSGRISQHPSALVEPTQPKREPKEAEPKLPREQEYVARWLDRVRQCSLRAANQQGIARSILEALVVAGRAERINSPEPSYRSTSPVGVAPDTAPAPAIAPGPVRVTSHQAVNQVQLTVGQERVARWLRKIRQVSLNSAIQKGVGQVDLDVLVDAGLAERLMDEGDIPFYRAVEVGARLRPGPDRVPRAEIKPLPASIDKRLVALLGDGEPRTQAEVASALSESNDFVARSRLAREVQRALPELVAGGHLTRISFGIPVTAGNRQTWRYEERYVTADSVVPVCASCFRNYWSADVAPPQSTGGQAHLCAFPSCRRKTNDAAYVPKTEFEERLK